MHGSQLERELHRGVAARLISYKAAQLVRMHGGLTRSDRDDVAQELRVAVHQAAEQYDAEVGTWKSFVRTIVERTADKLVRGRKLIRREFVHEIVSLSTLVEDEDGERVPLATQIGTRHREPLTGWYTASERDLADLRLDVRAALRTLSRRHRRIARLLALGYPQRALAGRLGISRRCLRGLVSEIHNALVEHDLGPNP